MNAMWAYMLPIVGPVLVILSARQRPFVWRHAIQALAMNGILFALVTVLKLLPPSGDITLAQIATGISIAALYGCGLIVYRGHALRMPWIADFADKWQATLVGLIDIDVARYKQQQDLRLHRRKLESGTAAPPRDLLPIIAGNPRMGGFHIECVGLLGTLAVGLLGERMKPSFTRSEIFVEKWPLRLGEESVVRFTAWPRKSESVERIAATLFCVEKLLYRDDRGSASSHGLPVHGIAVADAAAGNSAAGSTSASWTLHVPREGPQSFVAEGGEISWLLQVEMQLAGGHPATQTFDLLVMPQLAAR